MKYKSIIILLFIIQVFVTCKKDVTKSIFIPKNIVIAHRGSTHYTPEETEAAYRWARNIGAHYLEVDIQRSKDGVLMALHDSKLTRTTNIEDVFPERKESPTTDFTFEELMSLDAGSWFNKQNPEQANIAFSAQTPVYKTSQRAIAFNNEGNEISVNTKIKNIYIGGRQGISTLEDVIRIAEGYRIAKDVLGNRLYKMSEKNGQVNYQFYYVKDTIDSGDRPGVYIETKEPHLFPNIEKDLFQELDQLGWNILTKPVSDTLIDKDGKIRIGKTSAKIILQTFSPESLKNLYAEFKGQVPTCLLLWLGDPNMLNNDSGTYFQNFKLAKNYGAQIIGPSIAGEPNNYADLLTEQNYRWIKSQGFLIHPYSFDTPKQTQKYGKRSDGMFTNWADMTIEYYSEKKEQ